MTFGLDLLPPEVMVRTNGIFEIVPSMLQDGHNPKTLEPEIYCFKRDNCALTFLIRLDRSIRMTTQTKNAAIARTTIDAFIP